MRRADAPRAGWYPDPESRTSLRYWDGLDWTQARRSPPSEAELRIAESQAAFDEAHHHVASSAARAAAAAQTASSRTGRADTQQVIDEVRRATRGEVDRAADVFTRQARQLTREITPLISQYTNRVVRWVRFAAIVAVVLLIAYFAFQVFAQASLFEWIGDRIDNLTDENGAPAAVTPRVAALRSV